MILGITGSIGSGKTTVSVLLSHYLNFPVINVDLIAHKILAEDRNVKTDLVNCFGKHIIGANNEVDRLKLRAVVLGDDSESLKKLNAIIHPVVVQRCKEIIADHRKRHMSMIMDVPLLYETGLDVHMDFCIVVTVNNTVRTKRLKERSSISTEYVNKLLAMQLDQKIKTKKADFVIENNENMHTLETAVKHLTEKLKAKMDHK